MEPVTTEGPSVVTATPGATRGATALRRDITLLVGIGSGVVGLLLARRGVEAAAATGFLLSLVLSLAYWIPRALGADRLARVTAGTVLALAATLPFQSVEDPLPAENVAAVVSFTDARSRAYYELSPPPAWRHVPGQPFVYVGVEGSAAELADAEAILEVDGHPLRPLTLAPDSPGLLRAPLPPELLERLRLRFSFGFGRPSPAVGLRCVTWYRGSLDRSPSAWSCTGDPPPPGAALVPRRRGLVDRLTGKAEFELPRDPGGAGTLGHGGRYSIELWLLDPEGRVVATCY